MSNEGGAKQADPVNAAPLPAMSQPAPAHRRHAEPGLEQPPPRQRSGGGGDEEGAGGQDDDPSPDDDEFDDWDDTEPGIAPDLAIEAPAAPHSRRPGMAVGWGAQGAVPAPTALMDEGCGGHVSQAAPAIFDAALRALLAGRQHAALRELRRRRRVLLVFPSSRPPGAEAGGPGASVWARAHLLGGAGEESCAPWVETFTARWEIGATPRRGCPSPAARAQGWRSWRAGLDSDAGGRPGLSAPAGAGCAASGLAWAQPALAVSLGSRPHLDHRGREDAGLELDDPHRFLHALGRQKSLLIVVGPHSHA